MTSTPATVVASPRLALLDVLRFFAALSVLAYHWLYYGITHGRIETIDHSWASVPAQYGYLGVHLFFLISGFVIATSVQGKSPSKFAVGRLVRLYPAYWVAMLITSGFAVFLGSPVMTVTGPQVLANFTMVSQFFGQPYIDGVYWTLLLELAFYGMVFVLVLLGFRNRLDTIFPVWSLAIAIVALAMPVLANAVPALTNNALPIGGLFSLFAGGAIISTSYRRGWTWFGLLGLVAAIFTSVRHVLDDAALNHPDLSPGILLVIVFSMYGVILVQTIPSVGAWRIPYSQTLGYLTFPIYLLHAHIGYTIFSNFSNEDNKWLIYMVTLSGVVAASFLLHEFVEVRLKNFWYQFFTFIVGRPVDAISRLLSRIHPRLGGLPDEEQAEVPISIANNTV